VLEKEGRNGHRAAGGGLPTTQRGKYLGDEGVACPMWWEKSRKYFCKKRRRWD